MILEIYDLGESILEICSEHGLSTENIYNWKNTIGKKRERSIMKIEENLIRGEGNIKKT